MNVLIQRFVIFYQAQALKDLALMDCKFGTPKFYKQ